MTSRHECKLFNWYHYPSHRFDEWLLLFKDASGKQVVTRFGTSFCVPLFLQTILKNVKWRKKHSKVQFRRRTKTKRVAWSGPHATWRFDEARIFWQAVALVLFNYLQSIFWFVKNHLQLIEDCLSKLPLIVQMFFYMNFRGRCWRSEDILLSLLRQRY